MFYYLNRKSFQNDEEWRLFYCDSTLDCRVIQDFDLCKLDDLISLMTFSHHKVPLYVHCDISMTTQWALGPFHSKGKISSQGAIS